MVRSQNEWDEALRFYKHIDIGQLMAGVGTLIRQKLATRLKFSGR